MQRRWPVLLMWRAPISKPTIEGNPVTPGRISGNCKLSICRAENSVNRGIEHGKRATTSGVPGMALFRRRASISCWCIGRSGPMDHASRALDRWTGVAARRRDLRNVSRASGGSDDQSLHREDCAWLGRWWFLFLRGRLGWDQLFRLLDRRHSRTSHPSEERWEGKAWTG